MKAQNDYTRTVLDRIPGRDKLLDAHQGPGQRQQRRHLAPGLGRRYFYFRTDPGSDNRKLYVRDSLNAPERLLVDPEKLTTPDGKHFSIDYFSPSLDGRYVAYGVSPGGSEDSVLHVTETATGKVLPDTIDRAQFGNPTWVGGDSFFYTRTQKLPPGAPPTAKYQKLRAYHHILGDDPDHEPAVFGYQVSSSVPVTEDDFSVIAYSPAAQRHYIGLVVHGVKREIDIYTANAKDRDHPLHPVEEGRYRVRRDRRIRHPRRQYLPSVPQGRIALQGAAHEPRQA